MTPEADRGRFILVDPRLEGLPPRRALHRTVAKSVFPAPNRPKIISGTQPARVPNAA